MESLNEPRIWVRSVFLFAGDALPYWLVIFWVLF